MLLYNNKPLTIINQSSNKSRHVLRDFCSKNTVQKKVKWKKNRRWPGPGHFFLILPKHITEMSLIYLIISDWPPYFNREPIQSRLAKSGILFRNFFLSYCEEKYYQFIREKVFGPTVRNNCSSDREKLLKFQAEGQEFAKNLRSQEKFIQIVKGPNNFR